MYGGSPKCTGCGKIVYHAEQAMGPGRKTYHKLCLKCVHCKKRVDPGNLLQHNEEPYCAHCYRQLFSTRDLRTQTHHVAKEAVPVDDDRDQGSDLAPALPPRIKPRPVPPPQEYYTPPDLSGVGVDVPSASNGSGSVGTGGSPSTGRSIANSGGAGFSAGSSRGVSNSTLTISVPLTVAGVGEIDPRDLQRPNFRAEKPIPWGLPASVTGLSDRGLLHRVDSPRSKVGTRPVLDDMCSRKECGKRVYAAEQVVAIGKKWHRGCLRCTSCSSSIDPARVSDHAGQPWCKNCYAREHGPQGIAGKR